MLDIIDALKEGGLHPATRLAGTRLLREICVLSASHAFAIEQCVSRLNYSDTEQYQAEMRRIAYNLAMNSSLRDVEACRLVAMNDEELSRGTIVERIQQDEARRAQSVQNMLNEKYENVRRRADGQNESILRCRRCGSGDISWQQKQTRGADEAMTVFCVCQECKTKWRMS